MATPRSLPRLTKERLAAIIADHESGLSAYDLADKYDHNHGTIMKRVARAGVRSRAATLTDEEIAEWRQPHPEGLGYKTISRRADPSFESSSIHMACIGAKA